jgi:hypothetical protein
MVMLSPMVTEASSNTVKLKFVKNRLPMHPRPDRDNSIASRIPNKI